MCTSPIFFSKVWKVFKTNTALGREATTWTVISRAGADLKFRITYSGGDMYKDTKKHWYNRAVNCLYYETHI